MKLYIFLCIIISTSVLAQTHTGGGGSSGGSSVVSDGLEEDSTFEGETIDVPENPNTLENLQTPFQTKGRTHPKNMQSDETILKVKEIPKGLKSIENQGSPSEPCSNLQNKDKKKKKEK